MIKSLVSTSCYCCTHYNYYCLPPKSTTSLLHFSSSSSSSTNLIVLSINTLRRRLSISSLAAATAPGSIFVVPSVIKPRASTPFSIRSMSVSLTSSSPVNVNASQQLPAINDDYGGVLVHLKQPMDCQDFISSLKVSMSHWRQQGKKGIWIKLPIELVNLVEAAVKEGFWYHHAEPKYLMLVYWIPETVNALPVNATHRVGIGAFVMNDKREVLVVQEKSGKFRGTGLWKVPTGVIDEGEDICVGAVREVKEETGIDTEFVEVLAFRQSHKSFFNKSDLFFLCMLRPLSFDIQKQESEIEAAEWMPIEEYAAQQTVQSNGLLKYIIDVGLAKVDKGYAGFSPVPTTSTFSSQKSYLYLNRQDLNKMQPFRMIIISSGYSCGWSWRLVVVCLFCIVSIGWELEYMASGWS